MTTNRYDNLDFLLNIYNEAIYQETSEFGFEPIVRKNIQLADLKKDNTFDYNHIFDGEFKYLGIYNNRIHFKRKSINFINTWPL